MKAVALEAVVEKGFGQGQAPRGFGLRAVERRVEAGDLRQARTQGPDRPHGHEVVRLVQRRERRQGGHPGKRVVVDQHRALEAAPAMHHPMADRRDRSGPGLLRLRQDGGDQLEIGLGYRFDRPEPCLPLDLPL